MLRDDEDRGDHRRDLVPTRLQCLFTLVAAHERDDDAATEQRGGQLPDDEDADEDDEHARQARLVQDVATANVVDRSRHGTPVRRPCGRRHETWRVVLVQVTLARGRLVDTADEQNVEHAEQDTGKERDTQDVKPRQELKNTTRHNENLLFNSEQRRNVSGNFRITLGRISFCSLMSICRTRTVRMCGLNP